MSNRKQTRDLAPPKRRQFQQIEKLEQELTGGDPPILFEKDNRVAPESVLEANLLILALLHLLGTRDYDFALYPVEDLKNDYRRLQFFYKFEDDIWHLYFEPASRPFLADQ